jgi:hypothetical protein
MTVLKKTQETKQERKNVAIESHQTAAWANTEKVEPASNVSIPNSNEVRNAKDWVDSNEK